MTIAKNTPLDMERRHPKGPFPWRDGTYRPQYNGILVIVRPVKEATKKVEVDPDDVRALVDYAYTYITPEIQPVAERVHRVLDGPEPVPDVTFSVTMLSRLLHPRVDPVADAEARRLIREAWGEKTP